MFNYDVSWPGEIDLHAYESWSLANAVPYVSNDMALSSAMI